MCGYQGSYTRTAVKVDGFSKLQMLLSLSFRLLALFA